MLQRPRGGSRGAFVTPDGAVGVRVELKSQLGIPNPPAERQQPVQLAGRKFLSRSRFQFEADKSQCSFERVSGQ